MYLAFTPHTSIRGDCDALESSHIARSFDRSCSNLIGGKTYESVDDGGREMYIEYGSRVVVRNV
jgi:hypothetical protein